MKKILNILFIAVGVLVITLFAIRYWTKSHSPFEKIKGDTKKGNVEIGYCRPLKKDRKIFGSVVPYETVWRTGANEATTIEFTSFGTFGGRKVKAGKYSLWTIPSPNYWTVILNNETGQWGTNYDEKADYLRFKVKAETSDKPIEQLTIKLEKEENGLNFYLGWENTVLNIPIR